MADDRRLCYLYTPCAYCGKKFEAWIPKREWDSGKAMAKCKLCPLPTLLNPHTVEVLPTLVNPDTNQFQTGQSSLSTSSTSNKLSSPETPKPTAQDIDQFVREETTRVKDANPSLNDRQARYVAQKNWAGNGYDWWMRRQGRQ